MGDEGAVSVPDVNEEEAMAVPEAEMEMTEDMTNVSMGGLSVQSSNSAAGKRLRRRTVTTDTILSDTTRLLDPETEIQAIEHVRSTIAGVEELCETRQQSMAQLIRQVSAQVEDARQAAQRPEPIEAHQQRMQALEEQEKAIARNLAYMNDQQATQSENLKTLRSHKTALEARIAATKRDTDEALPRLTNMISLYTTVSNIKWDFNAKSTKGFIAPPDASQLVPFDIPAGTPAIDVADQLWGLISSTI